MSPTQKQPRKSCTLAFAHTPINTPLHAELQTTIQDLQAGIHAQHPWLYHKTNDGPAALGHCLSVAVHGVDQVEGGGSSGVVGPITAAQHPEVVAMQMKRMLLCAVASR